MIIVERSIAGNAWTKRASACLCSNEKLSLNVKKFVLLPSSRLFDLNPTFFAQTRIGNI